MPRLRPSLQSLQHFPLAQGWEHMLKAWEITGRRLKNMIWWGHEMRRSLSFILRFLSSWFKWGLRSLRSAFINVKKVSSAAELSYNLSSLGVLEQTGGSIAPQRRPSNWRMIISASMRKQNDLMNWDTKQLLFKLCQAVKQTSPSKL